jgi:cell division protease FtsH
VRDLFEQGKKNAPCIIFVDELDAVGRHRGAGLGGGHDEREQTLNQLLVEMDGFDTSDGVILLAATNRPDVLDPALLRPGRFDRQVVVDMPDVKGREGILKVHLRKIPLLADDVNVEVLARSTPGLSGADLANVINEGALLAARRNHDMVYMEDMDDAKDKIILGPERKSRILMDETRKIIAFHEAGHAIAGVKLPRAETLHKVTIVARGRAEGVTYFLPRDDSTLLRDREYLLDNITMALGGLSAEKLIFGRMTNGASGDIQQVTQVARTMVTRWGMSESLGPIAYGENEETIFLGRSIQQSRTFSEQTAQKIDDEVRKIVEECEDRCRRILKENEDALQSLAEALLERETLSGEDVELLLAGKDLPAFDREALEATRKHVQREAMTTADRIDAVLDEAKEIGKPGATSIELPKREETPAVESDDATDEQTQKRLFDDKE